MNEGFGAMEKRFFRRHLEGGQRQLALDGQRRQPRRFLLVSDATPMGRGSRFAEQEPSAQEPRTTGADAYWVADAYVNFSGEALSDLLRSTEFSIVANNLLDKAYLSAITENAAWLGAPRTISMTATVSF